MFNRICKPLKSNSFFLFGARGTGKSTLLKQLFTAKQAYWIDLLSSDQESQFLVRPDRLTDVIASFEHQKNIEWIVIDEVQKVPKLLDVVHQHIEKGRFKFALTGSSARKLKRNSANMLAGRAFMNVLFPLCMGELQKDFQLDEVLQFGSLPKVFALSPLEKKEYLRAYTANYIKEEIQAEQYVRKIAPFHAFLQVAAQSNGAIVNYSQIARDIQSDPVSVQSYFEILQDTWIGFMLPAFGLSVRKRQKQNPKFYFFDIGVSRQLGRTLDHAPKPSTYEYGRVFEHFIILEIERLCKYKKNDWQLSYFRTKDDAEVDLIIDRPGMPFAFIKIKSGYQVDEKALRNLNRILHDFKNAHGFCFSQDKVQKKIGLTTCLYWKDGFKELGLV